MKKIVFLFIIASLFSFGQNKSDIDITQMKDYAILKTKIDLTDIQRNADILPEFPGGINAFRSKFSQVLDASSISGSGRMETTAYFVIEKDGQMSNVNAIGNKQYSKVVVKALNLMSKTIWKPAILNNEPVRFLFSFPLTMQTE